MVMFELLEILATISGILMASSGILEALKIFKHKAANQVSLSNRLLKLIAYAIWVVYGFTLLSFPVLISNMFGIFSEFLVIIGYVKYRKYK